MAHEENSPLNITPGAIRFNTDSMKLEYFRIGMEGGGTSSYAGIGTLAAGEWVQITTDSPDIQTGGTRGLFAGGYASGASSPKTTNKINYVNISSTGDAQEFGTLSSGANQDIVPCGASRTRGVFRDGNSASMTFVTFASTGNSVTFGNSGLTVNRANGLSNETRGIHGGGNNSSRNQMEYITIASTGNAVDFGNLVTGAYSSGTGASSTRGIFAGCATHPSSAGNAIEYITIATLGNAADFGDLSDGGDTYQTGSSSNSTRMLVLDNNVIESIIISTLGNATNFGETSTSVDAQGGGASSPTRALFAGGSDPNVNIEYVEFATEGNAVDFGDLTYVENRHGCGMSNGHGGLG